VGTGGLVVVLLDEGADCVVGVVSVVGVGCVVGGTLGAGGLETGVVGTVCEAGNPPEARADDLPLTSSNTTATMTADDSTAR
jgi:hypothetical protein